MQKLNSTYLRITIEDKLRIFSVDPDQNHLFLGRIILVPASHQWVGDTASEPLSTNRQHHLLTFCVKKSQYTLYPFVGIYGKSTHLQFNVFYRPLRSDQLGEFQRPRLGIGEFNTDVEGSNPVPGNNVHFSALVSDENGSKCVSRHWDVVISARLSVSNVNSETYSTGLADSTTHEIFLSNN